MDGLPDIILGHIAKNLNLSTLKVLQPQYHAQLNTKEVLLVITQHNNYQIVPETLMDYMLLLEHKENSKIYGLNLHDTRTFLAKYDKVFEWWVGRYCVYWKSAFLSYAVRNGKAQNLCRGLEKCGYPRFLVFYECLKQGVEVYPDQGDENDRIIGTCLYEIESGRKMSYPDFLERYAGSHIHMMENAREGLHIDEFFAYLMAYCGREDLIEEYKNCISRNRLIQGYIERGNIMKAKECIGNKPWESSTFLTAENFTMDVYELCKRENVLVSNYVHLLPPGDMLGMIVRNNKHMLLDLIDARVYADDIRGLLFIRDMFLDNLHLFDSLVMKSLNLFRELDGDGLIWSFYRGKSVADLDDYVY